MNFEAKLQQLHDRASDSCQHGLDQQTRQLAAVVAKLLRGAEWGKRLPARAEKEFSERTGLARDMARVLDAVRYLNVKVLGANNSHCVDMKLKSDLRAVQDQIEAMFETKQVPERGFVYVAWVRRPEQYWYVGKVTTVDRLNLAAHAKLARAVAHATNLSMLFPSQSSHDVLRGVEESLLAIIEHHSSSLPRLNEPKFSVVRRQRSDDLMILGNFLEDIAKRIN